MLRLIAKALLALGIVLGSAVTASADELLAWWSFNNSTNSDQGDGLLTGNGFYFPVILNNDFDDGFYTGPRDDFVANGVRGDLMFPVYDRFGGANPGALIPVGADNFPGSTIADTADFLTNFGNDFGAVLDVSGLNGSNDGTFGNTGNGWGSFGGTGLNRPTGTFAGGSLAMNGEANNGSFFQIEADLSMYKEISPPWAQRGTGTGYTSRVVEVSTDGVNFTEIFSEDLTLSSTWVLRETSAGSLLNGATTAYIRWTIDGATSDFGNNRFDNIQLRGTIIPEPSSIVMMGLGVAGLAGLVRLRRRNS